MSKKSVNHELRPSQFKSRGSSGLNDGHRSSMIHTIWSIKMKNRFETLDLALAAIVCMLAVCVGCDATGEPQPQPTPEPQPSPTPQPTPSPTPDPINTNGAGDPVNTNGPDPIGSNGPSPIDTNGPVGTNGEPETPTQAKRLIGTWRFASGDVFSNHFAGFDFAYVRFDADSTVTFFYRSELTGVNDCLTVPYSLPTDKTVVFEMEPDEDVEGSTGHEQYLFFISELDSLRLTDNDLLYSDFLRETAVPSQFECRDLREEERFELPFAVDSSSELAGDGDSLWITQRLASDYLQYPFDPSTGAVGDAVDFGAGVRSPHFMQDGDLWYTQGLGGDTKLLRSAPNSTAPSDSFDMIHMSMSIRISAAALNPTDSTIVMHGALRPEKTMFGFMTVNAEPEPNELVGFTEFDVHLKSMTFDGAYLWGLRNGYLVLIDRAQNRAVATYRTPDPMVNWTGATKLKDDLWLVGNYSGNGSGVLMRVSTGGLIFDPNGPGGGAIDPVISP